MPDAVEMITELPLAAVLGSEFDAAEAQARLADFAGQWMGLDPAAGRGWHSNGTDLIGGSLLWETESDWLEIDIEIRRRPQGILRDPRPADPVWTVSVVLMVGCWCQDNHNAHHVEERRWDVGTVEALADRARSACAVAEGWLESSVDADYWRHRAGLQPRPGSTVSEQ